jgi:hypothetical protein
MSSPAPAVVWQAPSKGAVANRASNVRAIEAVLRMAMVMILRCVSRETCSSGLLRCAARRRGPTALRLSAAPPAARIAPPIGRPKCCLPAAGRSIAVQVGTPVGLFLFLLFLLMGGGRMRRCRGVFDRRVHDLCRVLCRACGGRMHGLGGMLRRACYGWMYGGRFCRTHHGRMYRGRFCRTFLGVNHVGMRCCRLGGVFRRMRDGARLARVFNRMCNKRRRARMFRRLCGNGRPRGVFCRMLVGGGLVGMHRGAGGQRASIGGLAEVRRP